MQQKPKNHNFSEKTIKSLDYLNILDLGYSKQDNYIIAIHLSLEQIKDLILYGVSWNQVLKPNQRNSREIIKLMKRTPLNISGSYFKLTKEQQENVIKKLKEHFKINIIPDTQEIDSTFKRIKHQRKGKKIEKPTHRTHKENQPPSSTKKSTQKTNNKKKMDTKGKNRKRPKR